MTCATCAKPSNINLLRFLSATMAGGDAGRDKTPPNAKTKIEFPILPGLLALRETKKNK